MKNEIRKTSLSALFSALIVVFILVGTFIEMLDMTVAAISSLIVFIVLIETGSKYPFLVYLTSSILCLILTPLNTATLYFISFFGYYPIIKKKFSKFKKSTRKIFCMLVFNISMGICLLLFKTLFALQNEPISMYVIFLITLNIFFLAFDFLLDVFIFIYFKKIRSKIKFFKR